MNAPQLVSVLVPIYNVAPYLTECLTSISAQTFANWNAICVNDGSADDSGVILDDAIRNDSRLKGIHQPNKGISLTRQRALAQASGKWMAWVDSDDFVGPDFLKHLVETAESSRAQLVWSDYYEGVPGTWKLISQACYPTPESIAQTLLSGKLWGGCWNKLFLTEAVRQYQLSFTNYTFSSCEDLCFVATLLAHDPICAYTPTADYFYRHRGGSLLRQQRYPTLRDILDGCHVEAILEAALAHLAPEILFRRRKQGVKYGAYTLKTVPNKLFASLYPEIRDLRGTSFFIGHKICFWLACRGFRPWIRLAFRIFRKLKAVYPRLNTLLAFSGSNQ